MAGFTLPKLRWLVLGAAAAGVWAMTQHVPPRGSTPKPESRQETARATPERPAQDSEARSNVTRAISLSTPQKIAPPQPKPSDMTTSSIPRPQKPVGPTAESRKLFAASRVRLRQKAATSAAVVMTLDPGQPVTSLSRDGRWVFVSVSGQKGWVHGDFLTDSKPSAKPVEIVEAMRPKVPVTRQRPGDAQKAVPVRDVISPRQSGEALQTQAAETGGGAWGGLRPARAPQGGDCQCPYDLMLSGKQCGDHSAYARRVGKAQCYF